MTKADKEGQRKAPILRFKGFTDDWEQRKLGEIGKTYSGLSGKNKSDFEKGNSNFVTFLEVLNNPVLKNIDLTNKVEIKENEHQNKVKRNDILFNTSSETPEEVATSTVVDVNQNNLYLNSFCFGFRPNVQFSNYYIGYYLRSNHFRSRVFCLAQGISRYNISKKSLIKLKLSLPKLEEQDKISRIFNQIELLLTLYEKKKQLLTQLKQGIVNFLITKNGQKPQLRFSGFNNNWESKSFEKLLNYEQPTKYIVKKADYISQGTPVLTANKSFVLGYTNETNVYQNIPAIIFDDFTLESKYVDFPFMVKSSAIKILTSENSNLFFIYQLLNNQRFVQEGHSRHYISVVQKKKVLVPSIQEQNKISDLIKQLEDNIELNSNTIVLLKKLKEFLLQSMFL